MEILYLNSGAKPQPLEHVDALPASGFLWLDFVREESPEWERQLQQVLGVKVHERHLKDSLNPAHPSYYDGTADYDMVIFRSLAPETEEGQFATRPTAFFLFDRVLVTVRPRDSRSILALRERLVEGSGRMPQRPEGLMHLILNAMVDRFLAMREPLSEQMEAWSAGLLDPNNPFSDWLLVMGHGSQLRKLEMLCEEQEDAILQWRENRREEVNEQLEVRYNDLLEHIRRVTKYAVHQQGETESLVQLHFSAVSHRTNEIMRVLTILSAIFLPLSFIAGVFGMNFENMPELHYHFAYYITLGVMALIAVGLLLLFRLKRWL